MKPLFDSTTRALLRNPTIEEVAFADKKAELLSKLRDTTTSSKVHEAVKEELRSMWVTSGADIATLDEILSNLPARREVLLKDIILMDPLHTRVPPKGHSKALLVTSMDERMFMVGVNAPTGSTEVPQYSKDLYGDVISGPVFLEDGEWQ